ncbi:hypothetical protein FNV43_RR24157 [Rhamnella rubrinervis]|uniref:Uncharacterized protein n=1 Tax=Rhamnella rubrinervis TaxID=2594499 RepID=A0A8K0DL74_9ROSA|nr:hypothetical protein FNV43_RR24157 [Rhamnella rubrinervis]
MHALPFARKEEKEEVVSILPNTPLQLHATRSWDFIGFTESHVKASKGGDVIIGVLDSDILAAFDDAIADRVDVISASIGLSSILHYWEDPVAIGSVHAMSKGILTSVSAGDDGPDRGAVTNCSPWLVTVAAANSDRKFVSQLALGNGKIFTGNVINNFDLIGRSFPLIWGGDAINFSANSISLKARNCLPGDLDSNKVKGKLLVYESRSNSAGVIMACGVGTIMPGRSLDDLAFPLPLPAALISGADIDKVLDYMRSDKIPVATILVTEVWKNPMAPYSATFSSRGSNPVTPDILKPDASAPGVNILAALSPLASPSVYLKDTRRSKFYLDSGTSMACPRVSGVAVYVKAAHPHWSPTAIKSAIMTTATVMNPEQEVDREFAYGSGLINPVKAVDPGLVFEASKTDYINFLCKEGYNSTTLKAITGDRSVCKGIKSSRARDLNYPSFALAIADGQKIIGSFTRKVTNVGSPISTYNVSVDVPEILQVDGPKITQDPIISGSITWKDGVHEVRTPLVTSAPKKLHSFHHSPQICENFHYRVARGGAPNTRLAVYKACWLYGCSPADILATFDDAIADGFNMTQFPLDCWVTRNFGQSRAVISNGAPCLLTVGASTMDRKFVSKLVLGNGQIFTGVSINSFDLNGTLFPLIWGGDAANYSANAFSLTSKGCIIMPVPTFDEPAFPFSFPATLLTPEDIDKVLGYIRSSHQGPNQLAPDILKPDLVAPDADILAAWSPIASPSIEPTDTRRTKFFINSGTSMSCSHITGVAANFKAINQKWYPAAIKSALI